ncbi:hypothetical protein BD779DRAFT_1551083 [Infundibulicybe gibba]|nr:hypothetical protein BD779DRAFT_1551083 [Infundibulicybe gibba]
MPASHASHHLRDHLNRNAKSGRGPYRHAHVSRRPSPHPHTQPSAAMIHCQSLHSHAPPSITAFA